MIGMGILNTLIENRTFALLPRSLKDPEIQWNNWAWDPLIDGELNIAVGLLEFLSPSPSALSRHSDESDFEES